MWEFSWLARRGGDEAEYADWGRVVDEAAARGYDGLRIDAFPHLVAAGADGRRPARHTLLPHRLWPERRAAWTEILDRRTDYWAGWAEARGLPLATTEGWGPINYADVPAAGGAEWGWVKEVCEVGVEMAVQKGCRGVSTSNFAQPHFRGMWADASWHRDLNRLVRGTDAPVTAPPPETASA